MTTRHDDLKAQAQRLLTAIGSPQWNPLTTGVAGGDHWHIIEDDESVAMVSANDGTDEELRQPRAEFIAAAPDLVRDLLATMEKVDKFISERDECVTALRNSTDADADYWRWQGHAEARRQLREQLEEL
jgi:hypothetical protein